MSVRFPPPSRRRPPSSPRPAARAVAALLAAAAGACTLETAGVEGPVNACRGDGDCPGGACVMQMCVAPEAGPLRVALAVSVAGATVEGATLGHATAVFPYEEGLAGSVVLPRPLTLVGRVRTPASWPGARRVDAEVFLTRQGLDVQEVPSTLRASTFAEAQSAAGVDDVDYRLTVAEGVPYAIRVSPRGDAGSSLPPLRLPPRAFEDDDGDGVVRFDAVYPDAPPVRYAATLVDADGAPIPGVTVEGVRRADGELVTSVVTTGSDGAFELTCDPAETDYLIRVSGLEPTPTVTFDPRYAPVDFAPVFTVPEIPFVRYEARVETAAGAPVPDAVATFRASGVTVGETGVRAAYDAQATADADGVIALDLVAGSYSVVVRAPSGQPLGLVSQSVDIQRPTEGTVRGQVFALPPRVTREGAVTVEGLGVPLVGARVQARALQSLGDRDDLGPAARVNRPSDLVTTDAGGAFRLALDEGAYDLLIEPAEGSGFAVTRRTVVVPGAAEPVGDRLDVEVPFPALLPGRVVAHDGAAVPGAEVAAYAIVDDIWGRREVPLGRTVADAEGAFLVVLPSR